MTAERDSLDASAKKGYDEWICNQLLSLVIQHEFRTVHAYLPIRSEIDIMPFIKELLDMKMDVFTSRTLEDGQLQHLHLNSLDELVPGKFGVPYPAQAEPYYGLFDLIVVPGLAFDQAHNRLGYGGGYYDRFLKENPMSYKLGIAYPFQVAKTLPCEAHDIQLDNVLYQRAGTPLD